MVRKRQNKIVRLAAIMFTDLVAYTALGQKNENFSLALLSHQRKLLRPIFNRNNGREIKTIGDSFLVEFQSALDAARCAYDIQRAVKEFNIVLPEEERIHLRIGLHIGDVVESDDGDISGDAVNVASRIEALADIGGVCLTRQVYDQVQNKLELRLESIGMKSLKNVSSPVETYKMVMPWGDTSKGLEKSHYSEEKRLELDKLRIAVLPFSNMSPDPGDEYFADGMTEELTSTISRVKGLRVISRTSVMQYKKTPQQLSRIGNELQVGSVIEGSVRKAGNRIRITVQLLDVSSDEHIWSEIYDQELQDVFEIQSNIAQQVAKSLEVHLVRGELDQVKRVATLNSDAYTLYLKARFAWTERTEASLSKAIAFLEQAIEKDPNFALAYSGLADCYVASSVYGSLQQGVLERIRQYAQRAIGLDNSLAEAHNSLAIHYCFEDHWAESSSEFNEAIELSRNYVTAHHWYAQSLATFGDSAKAVSEAEKARQLDPLSPTTAVTFAMVHLYNHEPFKAEAELESYLELNPSSRAPIFWLGVTYIEESRFQEAIKKIKEIIDHFPIANAALGYSYAKVGLKDHALNLASKVLTKAKSQYESACVASIYLALGLQKEFNEVVESNFPNGKIASDFHYRFFPWSLKDIWTQPQFTKDKVSKSS